MLYKRRSRILRHFWSPDFTRKSDQEEFFNSHACYRQQSHPVAPVVLLNLLRAVCDGGMPFSIGGGHAMQNTQHWLDNRAGDLHWFSVCDHHVGGYPGNGTT